MLKIEELIPSLNSDYKIERHRNSYGQGFGSYLYGYLKQTVKDQLKNAITSSK